MKTTLVAMIALTVFGTSAMADNFDYTTTTLTATSGNLEFSATGVFDNSATEFEDSYTLGAGVYVLPHTVGAWDAEVFVFGEIGENAADEFGVVGAEYLLTTTMDASTLTLGTEAAYVMVDDYDNGEFIVTPRANLEVAVTDTIAVFGEVAYAFNATEDFADLGGAVELGMDFAINDMVAVRPSIVRGFDTDGFADDTQAAVELTFNF
jgi:hypothetical protein